MLLLFSLLFYAWGEPKYILLMLLSIGIAFFWGNRIEKTQKKMITWAAVGFFLLLLCYFKYAQVALPLGISFYTFQIISYLLDIHYGRIEAQKSPLRLAVYISMFPQLVAGPIVRYTDVVDSLQNPEAKAEDIWYGIRRFVTGLAKKVLLANQFGEFCGIFKASAEKSLIFYWVYGVALILQYYYDFSGYSDMAIGLGRILGFHFPENFDYPYVSRSITEFWRRWHMSLGRWFKDYVYIPLGGSREGKGKMIRNIFIVWCLTGMWHGASFNFVLWGLYFAVILMVEKLILRKLLEKIRWHSGIKTLCSHGYVLFLVIISFVIFDAGSISELGKYLRDMLLCGNVSFITAESVYYLKSYGLLLLLGILGATGMPARAVRKFPKAEVFEPIYVIALFVFVTAFLVDSSFNPFLYFRF